MHRPHKVKWTWVEVGRRPYKDNFGKPMIMVLERCSVCGGERFRSEKPQK